MSLVVGNYSEMDDGDPEGMDKLNDETFGSGVVDSDWECNDLSVLGRLSVGEDLVHALQEDSEKDGHGNQSKPLTPVQGGPAFAVLNNGRSSQERDIPTDIFVERLNISDLEELWSNSPKQSSMLSDPVWSSPELPTNLRVAQEHTSPIPPPSKLISVEELEREMMKETASASPSPSQSPSPPMPVPSSHHQALPPHQQQPPSQPAVPIHPLLPFPPSTAAGSHMRPMYPPGLPMPMVHRHMVPHPMPPQHMIGHSMLRPGLPFPMPPHLPPNVPLMGPPRLIPPYGMFPHPAHMPPHMPHRMPHPHHAPHRTPHPMHPQQPLHPYHYQQLPQQLRPHHPPSKLSEMLGELRPDGSGFMNQKEKEWVVKVQLMQLQSGDPEVDDYYYQKFLQRQEAKASKGEGVVVASNKPLPLLLPPPSTSKEDHSSRSKAVEFEGTLGKVSVSSVSAPRQSINLSSSGDTTGSKGGGMADIKKEGVSRRKQVLIAVEEIYDLVMELEGLEHQTIILDQTQAEIALARKKKICSRIFALTRVKASFSDSPSTREREVFFQLLMQLRKGKRSFPRFLPFLSDDHAKALVFAMCKNMSSIVKKDLGDMVLAECIPAVCAVLNNLKMEGVNLFMSILRPLSGKLQENKLFSAMMVTLVKRGIDLSSSSELPDSVLNDWFSETKQVHDIIVSSSSSSVSSSNVLIDLLESLPHINR